MIIKKRDSKATGKMVQKIKDEREKSSRHKFENLSSNKFRFILRKKLK